MTHQREAVERLKALFAKAHEADDCHQMLEVDPRDLIMLETELRHLEVAKQTSEEPTEDIKRALDELRVAADICEIDENTIVVKQAARIRAARQVLAMRSQQSGEACGRCAHFDTCPDFTEDK